MIMRILLEIRKYEKKEDEFKKLCFLLTLSSINECYEYKGWTIHKVLNILY